MTCLREICLCAWINQAHHLTEFGHSSRHLQDNGLYFLNSSPFLSYKRKWDLDPDKMVILWAAAGLWIPCSSFHIPIPCHQIRSIPLETALSFMAGIRPEQFLWSAKALMKHEKKGPSGDKYLPVILRMSRESGMLNSITESSFSFLFSMRSSSCKKSMWPT